MSTRTFLLRRDGDKPGHGVIADGVQFPDNTVVLRWRAFKGPQYERGVRPTTVIFDNIDQVVALHCFRSSAEVVWVTQTSTCKHCGHPIMADAHLSGWFHIDSFSSPFKLCADNPLPVALPEGEFLQGYEAGSNEWECEPTCLGYQQIPQEMRYDW